MSAHRFFGYAVVLSFAMLAGCGLDPSTPTPPEAVSGLKTIAVEPFDDDLQSENAALQNSRFAAAFPAGPRVTAAIRRELSKRGVVVSDSGADATLSGKVTAAWVMSEALPTNVTAASYRLVDKAGEVLSQGKMEGGAYNNADAAADLAKKIVDYILHKQP